jgi:hypothetical protein
MPRLYYDTSIPPSAVEGDYFLGSSGASSTGGTDLSGKFFIYLNDNNNLQWIQIH